MSENVETAGTETKKRAPASNFLPIVRGRLPLLFVHAIRFNDVLAGMGTKDVAVKFGTSVGKVFDIRKGRNFSYVSADYKPTAEDVAAARGWIEHFGTENAKGLTAGGDKALGEQIIASYEAAGLATAEEASKLTEARASTRKPREPKAAKAAASAEDLLS